MPPTRVVRIGVRKPPRILIDFAKDAYEGRREWVPPSWLKVRWSGLEEFVARELRWEAVTDNQIDGTAQEWASPSTT